MNNFHRICLMIIKKKQNQSQSYCWAHYIAAKITNLNFHNRFQYKITKNHHKNGVA